MKFESQKGNVLLIVALVAVLVLGGAGYYFYSKGAFNNISQPTDNGYTLNTSGENNTSGSVSGTTASTSDKISLSLDNVSNGLTLSSTSFTLTGKTSPNAEVFVNDKSTHADASGNFSLNLTLDEGSNDLVVSANDADGNVAEQEFSVNVQTF